MNRFRLPAFLTPRDKAPPRMPDPLQDALKSAPVKLPLAASGIKRISIELADQPEEARKYAEKYAELVQRFVDAFRKLEIKPHEEERFLTSVQRIVICSLKIISTSKVDLLFWESMKTNVWDCDNSSFLVFDVARELGVNVEMVVVPKHAFIATENFFFETTSGKYFPIQDLPQRYPIVYFRTSDMEKIHSISYDRRGAAYFGKGDYGNAIKDFSEAIRLNPEQRLAYYNRGNVYARMGKFNRAIEDCSEAIRLDPRDAETYYNRAMAYFGKRDYDRAITDFSEAIRCDPRCVQAYNNRGVTHAIKEDYDSAINDYTESIRLNPKDAGMYCNRGNAYFNKEDYDSAINDYTESIRLNPRYTYAYESRGEAYLGRNQMGDQARAQADYDKAAQLKLASGR
jgi:tetratricopeptide (TPR) repeat protein